MTEIATAILPSKTELWCSKCGAGGEIRCSCGVEFIRAGEYAAKAINDPVNAGKSNRVIAAETGLSEPTVRRARSSGASKDAPEPGRVTGKDRKSYPAAKKKTANVVHLRDWKTGEESIQVVDDGHGDVVRTTGKEYDTKHDDHDDDHNGDHNGDRDGLKVEPAPIGGADASPTSQSSVAAPISEEHQVMVLEQFFYWASGAEIYACISVPKRAEVLAAFSVDEVIEVFREQLLKKLPGNPIPKLQAMDDDLAAETIRDAFGTRFDAIVQKAQNLRAPQGGKAGKQSEKAQGKTSTPAQKSKRRVGVTHDATGRKITTIALESSATGFRH